MRSAGQELIAYVQMLINTGTTKISLPLALVTQADSDALQEVRRLCALNGVEVIAIN